MWPKELKHIEEELQWLTQSSDINQAEHLWDEWKQIDLIFPIIQ